MQDQYARLEKHTQSGIDAVDKYTHFVKERHRIEQEYAANLKYVYIIKKYCSLFMYWYSV